MIMQGQQYGRDALYNSPAVLQFLAQEPLARAQAGLAGGAVERNAENMEIQARYQEYLRTQPEANPMLDRVMQLLGMTTQAYQNVEQTNPLADIMQIGAKLLPLALA